MERVAEMPDNLPKTQETVSSRDIWKNCWGARTHDQIKKKLYCSAILEDSLRSHRARPKFGKRFTLAKLRKSRWDARAHAKISEKASLPRNIKKFLKMPEHTLKIHIKLGSFGVLAKSLERRNARQKSKNSFALVELWHNFWETNTLLQNSRKVPFLRNFEQITEMTEHMLKVENKLRSSRELKKLLERQKARPNSKKASLSRKTGKIVDILEWTPEIQKKLYSRGISKKSLRFQKVRPKSNKSFAPTEYYKHWWDAWTPAQNSRKAPYLRFIDRLAEIPERKPKPQNLLPSRKILEKLLRCRNTRPSFIKARSFGMMITKCWNARTRAKNPKKFPYRKILKQSWNAERMPTIKNKPNSWGVLDDLLDRRNAPPIFNESSIPAEYWKNREMQESTPKNLKKLRSCGLLKNCLDAKTHARN